MGQFKAGQAVREIRTGRYGITTDAQRARTPQIPVMFLGASYPVLMQIDQLEHDNKEDWPMATEITNSDEIIDSRDIIERIEELTGYAYDDVLEFFDGEGLSPDLKLPDPDDEDVLLALVKFADLIDGDTSEFRYGVTLIREDYFETYAEDLARDLGYMSENTSAWPFTHIDWAAAADELKDDYTEFEFDGVTYYGRA